MKRKVRITRMPNLKSGAEVKLEGLRAGLGFNANVMPWPIMAGKMSEPDFEVNDTLRPVPRDEANLEAEKGEIAMVPNSGGIPDTYKIGGKRHYEGGTPLNLPDDSFIFSDTAKMRIKDPAVYSQFGLPNKKGGYTPAEIAKRYNVNEYKRILLDPNTDDLQRQTAEMMIANYNLKLAKLGLLQESMKGFPQGIPAISMPYIEEMGINPEEFVEMNPGQGDDETSESDMSAAYGGILNKLNARKYGGDFDNYGLNKYQIRGAVKTMPSETTQSQIPAAISRKLIEERNKDPRYSEEARQNLENSRWVDAYKAAQDQAIADERAKKIAESIAAQDLPMFGPNWKEALYLNTMATGDKFRLSNNPNVFDDYINPFVWIGDMASELGAAPLKSEMSGSSMPYLSAVANPLLMGRVAAAKSINPLGKQFWTGNTSNKEFLNTLINPMHFVPGYNNLETKVLNKARKAFREEGGELYQAQEGVEKGPVMGRSPVDEAFRIGVRYGTPGGLLGLTSPYSRFVANALPAVALSAGIIPTYEAAVAAGKAGKQKVGELTRRATGKDVPTNIGNTAANIARENANVIKQDKLAGGKGAAKGQSLLSAREKEKELFNKKDAFKTDATYFQKQVTIAKNEHAAAIKNLKKHSDAYDAVKATGTTDQKILNKAEKLKINAEADLVYKKNAYDQAIISAKKAKEHASNVAKEHKAISTQIKSLSGELDEAGKITAATLEEKARQTLLRAGKQVTEENLQIAKSAIKAAEQHAFKPGSTAYGTKLQASKAARQEARAVSGAKSEFRGAMQNFTKNIRNPWRLAGLIGGLGLSAAAAGLYEDAVSEEQLRAQARKNISGKTGASDNQENAIIRSLKKQGLDAIHEGGNIYKVRGNVGGKDTMMYYNANTRQYAPAISNGRMISVEQAFPTQRKEYGGDVQLPMAQNGTIVNSDDTKEEVPLLIEAYPGDKFKHPGRSKSKYTTEQWREFAKKIGFKPTINDVLGQIGEFQAYIYNNPKYKSIIDALHEKYTWPKGKPKKDEKLGIRWDLIKEALDVPEEPQQEPVIETTKPDEPQEPFDNTLYATKLGDLKRASQDVPWWLQDIIKTADAASDYLTVQQYEPWQATAPITLPKAVFYDPTRELAASAEQQNIAAQTLGQFVPPQQFNARMSAIQGEGAKQAANILGAYNKLNVELANTQEAQNAEFMNQAAALRAAAQTGLYDKYTIAKQQFDNAKKQAKNRMVNQYVQGVTNRAYTQALNSLYPQFAVDPSTGGMAIFHDPRSLRPSYSQPKTYQDYVQAAVRANPRLKTASAADINKAVQLMIQMESGNPITDPYEDYQKAKKAVPTYNTQNTEDNE